MLISFWRVMPTPFLHGLISVAQGVALDKKLDRTGDNQLQEKDLTEKQRRWLDASKKIGPGPMTKSERTLLEQLYADMEPREQQQLYEYIQMNFRDKEKQKNGQAPESVSDDPISRMQARMWSEPSGALTRALSSIQRTTPPKP